MKVLHVAYMPGLIPGVVNQMSSEAQAARELELDWDVKIYTHDEIEGNLFVVAPDKDKAEYSSTPLRRMWRMLSRMIQFNRWLVSVSGDYDVLLLRYTKFELVRPWYMKKFKTPVISVHHTLEPQEIKSSRERMGSLKYLAEMTFGRLSLKQASGLVGVTEEIVEYEKQRTGNKAIPSYIYPNGYLVDDKNVGYVGTPESSLPTILFVASQFSPWHGLDRLLDSIESSKSGFILHLVGQLKADDQVRAEKDSRIILHGSLNVGNIKKLIAQSDVGLSSFALDRKCMQQACTLKVREYLSYGLPVYAGYQDIFPPDFHYYKKGPAHIEEIIRYCRDCHPSSRQEIIKAATPYMDKKILLGRLHQWLLNEFAS